MDRILSLILLAVAIWGLAVNTIGLILYLASFVEILIGA